MEGEKPHMYYVGMDGHLDVAVCSIQNYNGKLIETFDVPATPEGMDRIIEKMKGKKFKILAETSTYTFDLHTYLISKGVDSILAHPHTLKMITESNKKTDNNDSMALASYLRLWDKGELELSISYIVSGDEKKLRDVCRYREMLANRKGETMQQIKSHMRTNSQYTEFDNLSTKKAQNYIRENFSDDIVLMSLLDDYSYITMKTDSIDKELEKNSEGNFDVKLLASIPGIGILTAVQLMSMIVDVNRFDSADEMRSYFGLAPKVKNSGEKVKHGHITKAGDSMMRTILGRIVYVNMNNANGDSIAVYYESHKCSIGVGKARMAAINKLLNIIYAVLKRGTPYIHR